MSQITIQLKDKEEETLIENLLNKMKIHFTKSNEIEYDFEFTSEMKKAVDESLKEDKSKFRDAFEVLDEISGKHGI